jgi:hypothetical protein
MRWEKNGAPLPQGAERGKLVAPAPCLRDGELARGVDARDRRDREVPRRRRGALTAD